LKARSPKGVAPAAPCKWRRRDRCCSIVRLARQS
jgi:hypothetical protein